MLSIKGREPFIRMQLWLNDPMNLERLKSGCGSLTPTHIAAEQLRRDIAAGSAGKRRFGLDSSSDRSSPLEKIEDDAGSNHGGGSDSPLAKRMRQGHVSGGSSGVDDQQREALMLAFALDPVPQTATVEFLSTELGIDQSAISSWYSSHKLRLKQLHGIKPESLFPNNNNTEESQQGIDPTKFRILMAHRRMEMQAGLAAAAGSPFPFPLNPAMFGLPPSSLPTSRSDTSVSVGGVGGGSSDSGLDVRFKNEVDLTNQDGGNGRVGGGEDVSDGDSDKNLEEDDDDTAQGSSRRKATAPQWMKPDWTGTVSEGPEQDAKSSEEPINGVCVRNIPDYESERGGLSLGGLPVVSSAEPVVSS
jgi:homeobox protein cut-like